MGIIIYASLQDLEINQLHINHMDIEETRMLQHEPIYWVNMKGFSADNLIKTCKIIFSEYGLSSNIVSAKGTNFISERFQKFAKLWHSTCNIIIIQLSDQRASRSKHQIHIENNEKILN